MSDKKHFGRSFVGKGYYIALILCAAAIGISGYLYYRNVAAPDKTQLSTPPTVPVIGQTDGADVPVIATAPTRETVPPDTTVPTQPQPLKTAMPVQGETAAGYAMDCLSFNETTRDWRVHNGIDITASAGTPVTAAADGTVYTVYEDDTMGHTVVIRHAQGYSTKYSSLDEKISVQAGDRVSLGDPIGYVGCSALLESALEPHVHFCVTLNDQTINPMDFIEK